jgi:lipopolysaccharide transport system permease protein
VLYNDVGRLVKIILTPLRYVTPVLWPIPAEGMFFQTLNVINPVTPLINGLRDLATAGMVPGLFPLSAWLAGYAVIFFLGWFLFHVSVPVLAEKA